MNISNKEQIEHLSEKVLLVPTQKLCAVCLHNTRFLRHSLDNFSHVQQKRGKMASNVTIESTNKAGSFPGVFWDKGTNCALIVVHEWWGLTETIKKQATVITDRCNISVLAPDLFRGWLSTEMSEASPHFAAFDWEAAMEDVAAAVKFLNQKGCQKVAITGFSFGGCISLAAAVKHPDLLAASLPCYGVPPNQEAYPPQSIRIPVQAHFCKKDMWAHAVPEVYLPMKEKMEANKVPLEFHEYDAGHSFLDIDGSRYVPELATVCYDRMDAFLTKHLK